MSEPALTPDVLVATLIHGPAEAQVTAAESLERMGTAASLALCAALRDVQAEGQALRLQLRNLNGAQVGDRDRLREEEARLRGEIAQSEERVCRLAQALHAIRDREALQPLFEALRRSHSREAHALAQALAPLGAPAVPLLDEALESRLLWVAMSAAEALTTIGGSEVAQRLAHRLETASHDLLRVCLIRCLGRLGDPAAVGPLCAVLAGGTRDEDVYAVEALGRIGDPAALDSVLGCLNSAHSSDLALQTALLRALGGLADPRGIAPLLKALQDPNMQLHEPAVGALAQIAERRPVMELRQALPLLRQRLRRSLGERESFVRACTALADRIETVTDSLKSLPLPAAGSGPDPDQLPRPVENAAISPQGLPLPAQTAGDPAPPGSGRRGPARWMQRWRNRS